MSSNIDKQQIRQILTAIARVSRGDYETRIEPTGTHGEYDSIIAGLNMMINEIRSRQEDLEEQGEEINALNDSLLNQIEERKQIENLYETLIKNSTTGIYITRHGKFVFVNKVFSKNCGYSPEELFTMNSIDLVHPDDREKVHRAAVDMLKGDRTEGYELRFIHKNGTIVWAIENITGIQYKGERAIMGNFVNITERKQFEESLSFSDTILKTINDAVFAMDNDFTIAYWNSKCEEMFGIKASDAKGRFIGDHIQIAQEYDTHNQERLRALEKGYNREEQLYVTPKGEVWVDVKTRAIERDGKRHGWVTIASDISERKRMEELIGENEEKYSTVFHANPMPMTVLSPVTLKVIDTNASFEKLSGYSRDDIVGKNANDLKLFVSPEQGTAIANLMKQHGRVDNVETRMRIRSGEERTVLLSARMIALGGEPYLVSASNDITEQKKIEQELQETNARLDSQNLKLKAQAQLLLEQREELVNKNKEIERANQMKSEFLASMSHELRTPLNAVIGFSELMLDGVTGEVNEEQKECLNDILSGGRHLLDLINDVLDLSKVEVGKMEFKPVELRVEEVISDSVQTVRALTEQKNHSVRIRVEEGIRNVYADKSRLRQVLLNLLSNATKFTPSGGKLEITAETKDEMCLFGVRDNGIGIRPEDRERIFEVFTQAETIEEETRKGTGLGLTLTRQFLLAMGGSIWVESEYGKGSVFYFTVPFAANSANGPGLSDNEELKKESSSQVPTRVRTALIIDDDAKARRLTGKWLKEEGFEVFEASNGEEGLKKAEGLLPDLIILDILMPEKDGWVVIRELKSKSNTCDIPVIIASVGEEQELAFSLGAIDYFNKPINKTRFTKRINELGLNKDDVVLVVDDNPADMKLIVSILEKEGIGVIKATGGKNAIDMMLRSKPSLIVLDLMLPDISGFEVLGKIRDIREMADIPIIVITVKDLSEDELSFLRQQAERIIHKTAFSREEFLQTVKQLKNMQRTKTRE